MNERIVGLDVGDVRIGVAVSDAGRMIATPLSYIRRVGWGPDTRAIKAVCDQYDTTLVVCGEPRNMDGSLGFQAEKVQQLCNQLEKAGLTVYHQDERLTTVTAERALIEGSVRRDDRKQHVDSVAAAIILQQWLDTNSQDTEARSVSQMNEKNENQFENQDEAPESNILELIDENGETIALEMIASLERDGVEYVALVLPGQEDDAEDDEVEVAFLRVEIDENDEDTYIPVEDEDLELALLDQLNELMDEDDEAE